MKTPYYMGSLVATQHKEIHDDDELRERMLENRLANRTDVREISVVTCSPSEKFSSLVEQASKRSTSGLTATMHWAIEVGEQYFELQRGHYDPTRTGLRMSKWDEQQRSQILRRYRQGSTAMTDDEIRAVGDDHFRRLNKMHINNYDIWCNNCQVAVLSMLRDIGGLAYYRFKLKSLHEWVRDFFCRSILAITRLYYRHRGCDQAVITRNEKALNNTLHVITSRSMHYPKRQWIKQDIAEANGVAKRLSTVRDHWFLTVLESSLSLRKGVENSYVRRGADGKPELNFEAVRQAVKGIFDDDESPTGLAWLKTIPWLTAGFVVGTPRWAAAVISIAVEQVSQNAQNHRGIRGGMEQALVGIGVSPKLQDSPFVGVHPVKAKSLNKQCPMIKKRPSKTSSSESKLVARYERCQSATGVPFYLDHRDGTQSWEPPEHQEMCLRILDVPLSRRWEEKVHEGRTWYENCVTGEIRNTRPGSSEIWVTRKKVTPDWMKPTFMALPAGWELCRSEDGQMFYRNHNTEPPSSTDYHPMRREIEAERMVLLPEWNVEWDVDRGKKYRNLESGEIRWKAVDGPSLTDPDRAKPAKEEIQQGFIEPLPQNWTLEVDLQGRNVYKNQRTGAQRSTHPLSDKRRILRPDWEMRYTPASRRYWLHLARDGRGTSWWTRNRLLKNTSLKNNARGWKLKENQVDWEWFEGGDIAHTEIPVLDLNDPADFDFREYPFLLPETIMNPDGTFLEPLPPDWVRRTGEDGKSRFRKFKSGFESHQHPCEEERESLPGIWEMRYTRHGRRYFLNHATGCTWWTNPLEDKQQQMMRSDAGQTQDGWRQLEDGRGWQRFSEYPNASLELQSVKSFSPSTLDGLGDIPAEERTDVWRSLDFAKDWSKTIASNDKFANAVTQFNNSRRTLSENGKLPKMGQWLTKSKSKKEPDRDAEDMNLGEYDGSTVMSEEPQSIIEPCNEPCNDIATRKPRISKTWSRRASALLKQRGRGSSGAEVSPHVSEILEEDSEVGSGPSEDVRGLGLQYGESPGAEIPSKQLDA